MSDIFIGLLFGFGVAGWAYSQLARRNGNANPSSNVMAAGFIGFIAMLFLFVLAKYVIHL